MRLTTPVATLIAISGTLIGVAAGPATAAAAAPAVPAAAPAGVAAKGAELANGVTGKVLWSRAAQASRPMGSIAKVMTALVVIKAGHLDREITVPRGFLPYVHKYDASVAGLVPGDKLTVRQLLAAMLIPSGCDAAYTLAYAYGPGRSKFIAKMNALARGLGLTRTHFTDFSGLPDPAEWSTYSTPASLVKLGIAAMRSPVFRAIVRQRTFRIGATRTNHAYSWRNTNLLLGAYKGAVGIKTGSTRAAGYCLLFEAVRGAKTRIGVVLDSSRVAEKYAARDAATLLNWGFRH